MLAPTVERFLFGSDSDGDGVGNFRWNLDSLDYAAQQICKALLPDVIVPARTVEPSAAV